MAKMLCVFLGLAALSAGALGELKCYSCQSSNPDECKVTDANKNNVKQVTCGQSAAPGVHPVCLTREITYKASGSQQAVKNTTLTCSLVPASVTTYNKDTLDDCKPHPDPNNPNAQQDVTKCEACTSDLCNVNSAGKAVFSLFTILSVPAMFLVLSKYVLQ